MASWQSVRPYPESHRAALQVCKSLACQSSLVGSKAKSSCYPSYISHMELWKKFALFSRAMDSEELCWLLGCPGLLGPRETWSHLTFNHGNSPGMLLLLRRCQNGIYFRNMLSQKSIPGLKWPPEASPECGLGKASLPREVQARRGSEK